MALEVRWVPEPPIHPKLIRDGEPTRLSVGDVILVKRDSYDLSEETGGEITTYSFEFFHQRKGSTFQLRCDDTCKLIGDTLAKAIAAACGFSLQATDPRDFGYTVAETTQQNPLTKEPVVTAWRLVEKPPSA